MKKEYKNIKLELGNVSWDNELGIYYIDMRPALVHYLDNIYGGKFDDNGVPMIHAGEKWEYYPINIAQYGFMLHADYYETRDEKTLQILKNCLVVLENIKTRKKDYDVWLHHFPNKKYHLTIPWASAMAQGEVISFYLRMYQILKDEKLLDTAMRAYNFLKLFVDEGGVRRFDKNGNLWFEEYPTRQPLLVLNGFIYTIFGLIDLYRITKKTEIKKDIDETIKTLEKTLHDFDAGFWSFYDLGKKELVRYYYQKNVHVPQLEVLYKLTRKDVFLFYKRKWEKQLNVFNYSFVLVLYRLKNRMPWLYNKILSLWKK